jgi:RNA polymerase-associated protein LEO1
MSNEEEFGSEEENENPEAVDPEEGAPNEKANLLQELFGPPSDESEEEPGTPPSQSRGNMNELKRSAPEPSPGSSGTMKTKSVIPPEAKKMRREEGSPREDDDNMEDNEPLPTFSSSLDHHEDGGEEEHEIRVEEMPYVKPPDDCPLHYFKLAGLGIEPRPFDENYFQTENEEVETKEKKKKKATPLTIRWRYALDKDQQEVIRESNARVVRWTDGSMHLFVGKEAFGIHEQEFKDYHHLFIRQRKDPNSEAFLQCHGILEKKMVLIPTDNSQIKKETLQKLKNLKSLETSGIRRQFVASTNDPEKEKRQKEQLEDSKSDLRKQFGINQELSVDMLELNVGDRDEEEKEKAREARIMAAKVAGLKDIRPSTSKKPLPQFATYDDNASDSG